MFASHSSAYNGLCKFLFQTFSSSLYNVTCRNTFVKASQPICLPPLYVTYLYGKNFIIQRKASTAQNVDSQNGGPVSK